MLLVMMILWVVKIKKGVAFFKELLLSKAKVM
jgi:hypothetical protein